MAARPVLMVLLILLSTRIKAEGPYYVFRNVTTADGLASNFVNSVLQDEKGFMWIATDIGLQRYDGYSFITYYNRPFDGRSLGSDIGLLEDRDHNIWTSSAYWGFNILYPGTGTLRKINDSAQRFFRNLYNGSSICQDDDGNIWLLATNSLAMYDIRRKTLTSYNQLLPPGEAMQFTRRILWDPRLRCLWINSTRYGICQFDPAKKTFYYRGHHPGNWPATDLQEGAGLNLVDRETRLWISTYSGRLLSYDQGARKWEEYYFDGSSMLRSRPGRPVKIFMDCMMQDREGTIWAVLNGSVLMRLEPGASTFATVQPYPNHDNRASNYLINALYEDRDGNIWAASSRGIQIFNPRRQRFNSVPLTTNKGTLADYSVTNFLETRRGDVWVATFGAGIYVYDQQWRLKRTYYYRSPEGNISEAPGEPLNRIWSLIERPDGKIWAGSQHGWLAIYDPVKDRFTNSQPPALDRLTIINMIPDGPERIWLTLYHGFAKWEAKTNSFIHYKDQFMPFRGSTVSESLGLVPDHGGTVWISTLDHGLQQFDPTLGRCVRMYAPRPDDTGSISSVSILSIIPIGDSLLGLGTADGGIDIFNRGTGKVKVITTANGLPSNTVSALWYRSDQLWAATSDGLCRVDLRTRRVTRYDLPDGVVSRDFADLLGFYQLRDGRLLAGYRGGFVSFYPDSVADGRSPADVRITGVSIFDRPLRLDSALDGTDTLVFTYRENFITLEYASLCFPGASDIRYYYELEGIDHNWVDAGNRRYISFANLATGSYVFRVRARDREGNFSKGTTRLVILIKPPFWKTWWFYILITGVTAGMAYVAYHYALHQRRRVAAVRNKISRDLHDDLGATLSSITVLSEIARTKIEEGRPEQTFPLLGKIHSYSGEMVSTMRDIVWAIDPRNDTLSSMIKRLKQYGAEWCAQREIRLQFSATNEFVQMAPPMNIRKNLYLICKEALYNAVRHSGASNIFVDCRMAGSLGEVVIADDGRGFDPGTTYEGNGLKNMRARAEEIGAGFAVHSSNGRTEVTVRLNVPRNRD
jgi:ligand-binding sensor domain-containing protein